MTLPTLVRTWQFQVNQISAPQGSVLNASRHLMRMIKESFKGSGTWTDSAGAVTASTSNCTVQSSCDGSGGAGSFGNSDGVDRWVADANLIWAAAASNHSWIVLRQTGVAVNYEVCIDLSNASSNNCTIAVSFTAGFGSLAAGTATARPTATDEQVILNNTQWGSCSSDVATVLHVLKSSLGQSTRVILTRASTNASGPHTTGFWIFELPGNVRAGWTNPSATMALLGEITSNTSVDTSALTSNAGNTWSRTAGGTNFQSWWAMEGETAHSVISDTYGAINTAACVLTDVSQDFPGWPILLYSTTVNARGVNGELVDMWWGIDQTGAANIAQGRSFPATGTLRQFMQFGAFIQPWNRSVPVLLK